jgi:hypothetical protein
LPDGGAKYDRRCAERPDDSGIQKGQNHVFVYGQNDLEVAPRGRDPVEERFDVFHALFRPHSLIRVSIQGYVGSFLFGEHYEITESIHLGRLAVDGEGGSFEFGLRSGKDYQEDSDECENGKNLECSLESALEIPYNDRNRDQLTQ